MLRQSDAGLYRNRDVISNHLAFFIVIVMAMLVFSPRSSKVQQWNNSFATSALTKHDILDAF